MSDEQKKTQATANALRHIGSWAGHMAEEGALPIALIVTYPIEDGKKKQVGFYTVMPDHELLEALIDVVSALSRGLGTDDIEVETFDLPKKEDTDG